MKKGKKKAACERSSFTDSKGTSILDKYYVYRIAEKGGGVNVHMQ